MGQLRIMGKSGDEVVTWEPSIEAQVEKARTTFSGLREQGFNAYGFETVGGPGEVIKSFDPDLERIVMAPALAGG